jgi:hypothetical protein
MVGAAALRCESALSSNPYTPTDCCSIASHHVTAAADSRHPLSCRMSLKTYIEGKTVMGLHREVAPYDPKKFAEFRDQKFELSHKELCAEAEKIVKPLEEKAFEAGRLAGLAEAKEEVKTDLTAKLIARRTSTVGAKDNGPVSLANRATELKEEARAKGKEISTVEATRAAYREAGVPLR